MSHDKPLQVHTLLPRNSTFLMLGKILNGRYHIIQKLGGGGFGETYLALDQWLDGNPQCVVKQLRPDQINPTTLRLFDKEAQTLLKLGNHDQVPQLLAHFEQAQNFYLVQEFIEGHDLREEIKTDRRLDETEVIKLLQDILEVLTFVHRNNVIHRDIKPANIMRRHKDGKIVLIDFGGVKQVKTQDSSTVMTPVVGTLGYMPLEQINNEARSCSDVYAVGMLAIQALTGLQPLQLQRDNKTAQLIWRDLARVSNKLADALDKMVHLHFTERYQSAAEALDAVKSFSAKASYWFKRGYELAEWKDYEKAVTAYDRAIQIQPDYYQVWYNRGLTLRKLKRYNDALVSYHQAIKLKPDYYQAWYSSGRVLYETSKYQEAIASYDQAIKIKSDYYQAWYARGLTLDELGRPEEAIVSYDRVIKIRQDDPEVWTYRGNALYSLGRYKEAIASFDKALAIQPDYQLALENRKLVEKKLRKPIFLRWLGL